MQYVSENRFVELLNEELVKHPRGAYMHPFIIGPNGYDWPHDSNPEKELVYRHVANAVREHFGIRH